MQHPRIDISQDLEEAPVVYACFDLRQDEIEASVHAIAASAAERFRMASVSADEVLELRELTALADELTELAPVTSTVVLSPARLSAYRDALGHFVETRDEADWTREEDREPLALLRAMLPLLEQLCAEAVRAALSPPTSRAR
jgi:hypothetical protein